MTRFRALRASRKNKLLRMNQMGPYLAVGLWTESRFGAAMCWPQKVRLADYTSRWDPDRALVYAGFFGFHRSDGGQRCLEFAHRRSRGCDDGRVCGGIDDELTFVSCSSNLSVLVV